MRQSLLVLVPVVGLMAGCAASPAAAPVRAESPQRQCFFQQQVENFRSGMSSTLYLKVRGSGVYELTTAGDCDLGNAVQLAIVAEMGSSRLCTDDWVTLGTPARGGPPQTCRAFIEKTLSDAEVAALPARYRP